MNWIKTSEQKPAERKTVVGWYSGKTTHTVFRVGEKYALSFDNTISLDEPEYWSEIGSPIAEN